MSSTTPKSRSVSAADSAEVGSSSTSSRGRRESALASSTSCWSAMPSSCTSRRSTASLQSSPSPAATSRAAGSRRRSDPKGGSSPCAICSNSRFSATDSPGTTPSSMRWCTVSIPRRRAASGPSAVTSGVPATVIVPCCSGCTPASTLISVDLPAPLAPISASTSPASHPMLTPRSTGLPPNACRTSCSSTVLIPRRSELDDRDPVGRGRLGHVQLRQLLAQLREVADLLLAQEVLRDQRAGEHDLLGAQLAGQLQRRGADDGRADRVRVGGGRGDPRAALGRHDLDVGGGDVYAVDLDLALAPVLAHRRDRALGQLVVRREDARDARAGLERRVHQLRVVGGDGVGELADEEPLV